MNRMRLKDAGRASENPTGLRRTLRWPQLLMLGIGTIVGSGIYSLIGIGAGMAGPSLILTFALAGLVCALAVLAYAELATMLPEAGGAYSYAYAGLGEIAAWVVGWSLILEYSIASSAVAVGWSAYAVDALALIGVSMPSAFGKGAFSGGIVNLPAMLIVVVIAVPLLRGTQASARLNAVLVALKLSAILVFVVLASAAFKVTNLLPFMPHGFWAHRTANGEQGTLAAAAMVFFAFFGFDAVATAAEETRNPRRDVPFGLLGTILGCVLVYVVVSVSMLAAAPAATLAGTAAPLAVVMQRTGHGPAALGISGVAIIALPAAILGLLYGQSRLLFAMARDGLLPARLVSVDQRTGNPHLVTGIAVLPVALVAGLLPLDRIVALANAGALIAFIAVPLSLLVLRRRWPDRPRSFRCPMAWLLAPIASAAGCLLFLNLSALTLWSVAAWNLIGLCLYRCYGRRRSRIGTSAQV